MVVASGGLRSLVAPRWGFSVPGSFSFSLPGPSGRSPSVFPRGPAGESPRHLRVLDKRWSAGKR